MVIAHKSAHSLSPTIDLGNAVEAQVRVSELRQCVACVSNISELNVIILYYYLIELQMGFYPVTVVLK
jgi:hypothetical protein